MAGEAKGIGCLAVIVIVVVFGGISALFGDDDESSGGGGSSNLSRDDDAPDADDPDLIGDGIGAQVVCREFVERRLKAPSTADYSDEEATHLRGKTWVVVGNVDAENSFGAPIRNSYTCRTRFEGDDEWTLLSLTGLDS